jgi:hypothetical protein
MSQLFTIAKRQMYHQFVGMELMYETVTAR